MMQEKSIAKRDKSHSSRVSWVSRMSHDKREIVAPNTSHAPIKMQEKVVDV